MVENTELTGLFRYRVVIDGMSATYPFATRANSHDEALKNVLSREAVKGLIVVRATVTRTDL
jgi:hypothetical protein